MLIPVILVAAQAMRMLNKLSKLKKRWHLNAPNESFIYLIFLSQSMLLFTII